MRAIGKTEAVDFFADLLRDEVHVGFPLELEGDVALAGFGNGADGDELRDDAELLFERAGDDALHFLGGSAGINRAHREGGVAHVGHEREGEALEGDPAEHHDGHHHHQDGDGALDGEGVERVVGPEFRGVEASRRGRRRGNRGSGRRWRADSQFSGGNRSRRGDGWRSRALRGGVFGCLRDRGERVDGAD